jgi:hypothetical protein
MGNYLPMITDLRDEIAKAVLKAMIIADWKFEVKEGKTWDDQAAERAYGLADKMMKEREITNVE